MSKCMLRGKHGLSSCTQSAHLFAFVIYLRTNTCILLPNLINHRTNFQQPISGNIITLSRVPLSETLHMRWRHIDNNEGTHNMRKHNKLAVSCLVPRKKEREKEMGSTNWETRLIVNVPTVINNTALCVCVVQCPRCAHWLESHNQIENTCMCIYKYA